jgi:hypothetical protein
VQECQGILTILNQNPDKTSYNTDVVHMCLWLLEQLSSTHFELIPPKIVESLLKCFFKYNNNEIRTKLCEMLLVLKPLVISLLFSSDIQMSHISQVQINKLKAKMAKVLKIEQDQSQLVYSTFLQSMSEFLCSVASPTKPLPLENSIFTFLLCFYSIDLSIDCLTPDYGYVSEAGKVEATAGFATFAASHLVVNYGKWYYEVIIHKPDVGQIGWANPTDFKVNPMFVLSS